ncbi:Grx4 family monothiol glutaredoxin [Buchnera aphidicola]|uniref:Grx4 family monothiol glutaredoxin n=1 Tax=Buchnera aphidicola TaxID=9 RepID=UPI0031B81D68
MKIFDKIKKQINNNSIIIYMKGSPDMPNCGFSARAVKILLSYKKKFSYVDVLKNEKIRKFLPKYSNWPTFPQLWINGVLIGGCDIIVEMFNNGELKKIISKVN